MRGAAAVLVAGLITGLVATFAVEAQTALPRPQHVISVYDGDTFRTREDGPVRLAEIDAPEIGWRAKCQRENELAREAQDYLLTRTLPGVSLVKPPKGPDREKYGRLLRRAYATDGGNIGDEMVSRGLAVSYTGRGPRPDWCKPGGPGAR